MKKCMETDKYFIGGNTMVKQLRNKQTLFFLFVFIACGVFLIWKAPHGYIFNDEPFMLSLGHRIIKGDVLFVSAWNRGQTTGLIFAPFIWVYTKITGSMEGVILFCRYLYVLWWAFTGFILYRRLKQFGFISIVVSACFLLYTPLDEMTFTYNAVSLSCTLLFLSYFLQSGNKVLDYLNGAALAVAVLVYPYLLLLYFVYAFFVIVIKCTKLKEKTVFQSRIFDFKLFLRTTISSGILAICVILFVLSSGINNVVNGVKAIFSPGVGGEKNIFLFFMELYNQFPLQIVCGSLIILISLIDKNRTKRSLWYFTAQGIVWVITVFLHTSDFNCIMFPICYMGLQAFILMKNRNMLLMFSLGVSGLIYAICGYIASDTGVYAISNGATVASMASIVMVYLFSKENMTLTQKDIRRIVLTGVLSLTIAVQLGGEAYLKLTRTYWDSEFTSLNEVISDGAAKGIITTSEKAEIYNKVLADINTIKADVHGEKKFLSLSLFPSIYLDMDYDYGTYSSWTYANNRLNLPLVNEKLKKYYNLNPEREASIIYISNEDFESVDEFDFVDLSKYEEVKLETGVFYISKN
ncbi:MAG: hypothetical protein J1E41_01855 [Ruminococcus sp.]|nr:hypothetical protein [Ruminococcus sp.]